MSNNYYVFTPRFIPGTKVRAGAVNAQFDLLEDAFDLLPTDPGSIAQGKSTLGVESGSGNAYVVTMTPVRTANADGDEVVFKATHQNSGASTLQVDAVAAAALVRWNGDPLSSADILSGSYYVARYDSANSRFLIVAPAQSTIVGAITYAAPTASVGLAADPGVATTVMRSDAAPALDQGIVPTWSGQHTFSQPILGANGTNLLPAFSFSSDPNTGAYRVGADNWGVATNGALRFDISTTAVTSTLPFLGANGSNTGPTFSFSGDPNTGSYNVGADDWGVATGGTLRFDISTTAVTSTLPFLGANGSNTGPTFSFSGDPNTGSYSVGADDWGVATGGTLRFDISTTAITSTLPHLFANGTAGAPGMSFASDPDTGFYRIGANQVGLALTGGLVFNFATSGMYGPNGTAALPSYAFQNAATTGVYLLAAGPPALAGIAADGVGVCAFYNNGIQALLGTFLALDGTVGAPGFNFSADQDTGIYRISANQMGLAAGGALGITVDHSGSGVVRIHDQIAYTVNSVSSVTAGGASALPSNPQGYFAITINGTQRRVPYYPE